MKGSILNFQSGNGVISCEQGNRYNFSEQHWKSEVQPLTGMGVDFVLSDNAATEIYQSEVAIEKVIVNQSSTSTLSIVSLIFGILGLFLFGSVIAIICGHIARSKIKDSGGLISGDGMALTGLILGYIAIVLWLLWIFFIGGIAFFA